MAKCVTANEYGNPGYQAIEKVEDAHCANADEVKQRPLHTEVCEGLVQAFVDPVPPTGCSVCLHRRPSQLVKWLGWGGSVEQGFGRRLHAPKPGQYIGSEHGNPRASGNAGKCLLGSRFAVRELVAANNDGDQARDLRNRSGKERLHCGESGIERRLRHRKRRKKDEQSE
jgi:hypothetical protein